MSPSITALVPYIIAKEAERAIAFYCAAFGAHEVFRMTDPGDGRIGHAQLAIGPATLMVADEYPDFGAVSPDTIGGTPVTFHLTTDAVDALTEQAVAAGATLLRGPGDQSFGERLAVILDPYGHRWMLAQPIEDVTPAEMQRRWEDETSA